MAREEPVSKQAISLTLSPSNIAALTLMKERIKYAPSISMLVDEAVTEYVARKRESNPELFKPSKDRR